MKSSIVLYAIFFCVSLLHADPLLVAVLMVKDEAPVMEMTLQPLVQAGITDFLIYDTGSTDDTIQITQEFFIKNNISNFVIEQGDWIDFATSRNRALELTEEHFPDATFMLMLDAEWILHNGADLLKYCKQQQNNSATLYLIQLKGVNIEFGHARLIRCKSNLAFVGKIHEIINEIAQAKIPDHIYFELNPTRHGKEKSKARWQRDCNLLLQELQENPDNPRTVYYLAQTYFCLQDWQNAIKWFHCRMTMSGSVEEDYSAIFLLAQSYGAINDSEKMIYYYLQAFCKRPSRAEPLIRLAEYYYQIGAYELSYLFARHSVTIPYPHDDVTFIEKLTYDFLRYNLLSSTAYYMGDFKLGKQATLKALKACPEVKQLYENLKQYEQMLNEQTCLDEGSV